MKARRYRNKRGQLVYIKQGARDLYWIFISKRRDVGWGFWYDFADAQEALNARAKKNGWAQAEV